MKSRFLSARTQNDIEPDEDLGALEINVSQLNIPVDLPAKLKSNFFNELTMEGLKSFYNRSRIEYDDFRRLFEFKDFEEIKQVRDGQGNRARFLEKC